MTPISFIFDDGFSASSIRTAEIFEAKGLRATFAVLADPSEFIKHLPKGDFRLWNELQARGHTIHPHGFDHADLTKMPYNEAVTKIRACLQYFEKHLEDFKAKSSIYHFPYNRSTQNLETYLLKHVRAIRTTRNGVVGSGFNSKHNLKNRILSCTWHGPDSCNDHLLETITAAEQEQPHLLLYMLHGLDGEGWGSLDSNVLEHALDIIIASPNLSYVNLATIYEPL